MARLSQSRGRGASHAPRRLSALQPSFGGQGNCIWKMFLGRRSLRVRAAPMPQAVRVSILVRSAFFDSRDHHRRAAAMRSQAADTTREIPYAIPLLWRGRKNVSPKEGTGRRASPGPEATKNGGCGASSDCRMEGAQGGALQPGLQKEKTNPFDSAQQRQGPRRNPGRSGSAPARATRSRRPRAARTGAAIQDGPGVSSPPRTARSSAPCRRPSPPRSCRSP